MNGLRSKSTFRLLLFLSWLLAGTLWQGAAMGEEKTLDGLWFKQSCFEESAKSPFIISVPGFKSAGKVCRRTVELVDKFPTLAELTGLQPLSGLEGYSLVRLLKNPLAKWDHPAYTQVQRGETPGHSVRTERWRYTEWGFGEKGAELYDELNDPYEQKNLAGDPEFADIVRRDENPA